MQRMLSQLRRCVDEYDMIEAGDRIAVGVSGGKDSLALLRLLAALRAFYPKKFELTAVTLDMGFGSADFSPVAALCEALDVPFVLKQTEIGKIVFDVRREKNPCALCAALRRGCLNDTALELGCGKVALGHHLDDAVETFMLSLFYEGRINCFSPVTHLDRTGLTVIRPLLYLKESEIARFAAREKLPVCKSGCPADSRTNREEIKQLLRTLEQSHRRLRERIFGAMQRYPLEGWAPGDPHERWLAERDQR